MSRREDHVSCIDVTIMDRFAHSALPSAYSKIFPAFRAGAAVTPAAGLGGKRFIDFIKPQNSATARAGHPYSIPKFYPITPWQTSRNAHRGRHARLRVSLSLAGLNAGVSRG